MAGLLVSVRSPEEAIAALEGGAALIDVKEPTRGALGRADHDVIDAVVKVVSASRPVSAALGEWLDIPGTLVHPSLTFVKWGLAGCARRPQWRQALGGLLRNRQPKVVLVAYADWECAQAPSVEEVFALAREHEDSVMLVDTCCKVTRVGKPKPTLLDWLPRDGLVDFCARCRQAKVRIALAGSLGVREIDELLPARPDWFAVRGAACAEGDRRAGVEVAKVRQLVRLLKEHRED